MTQRLFLFDLDGTLVDSAPDLAGAMNEMLAARGLPERPLEELREPSGHGGPALLKAAFGMERTDPRFEAMRQEFLALRRARHPIFNALPERCPNARPPHCSRRKARCCDQ